MLTVETIARVRREHAKGRSIRAIARSLKVSRETVSKYLRSGETAPRYERHVQPYPRLAAFQKELERLVEENDRQPVRDRLDYRGIFKQLQAARYQGGYDAVRRYYVIKRWKQRQPAVMPPQAFVPLTFAPGEAYQFDWAEDWIVLDGVTTKVQVAHIRLCHSRMPFVQVYPRQTQEMLFDAHAQAVAFYGGLCERGIYDNMKTARRPSTPCSSARNASSTAASYRCARTTWPSRWRVPRGPAGRRDRLRTRSGHCVSACSPRAPASRRWTS